MHIKSEVTQGAIKLQVHSFFIHRVAGCTHSMVYRKAHVTQSGAHSYEITAGFKLETTRQRSRAQPW